MRTFSAFFCLCAILLKVADNGLKTPEMGLHRKGHSPRLPRHAIRVLNTLVQSARMAPSVSCIGFDTEYSVACVRCLMR